MKLRHLTISTMALILMTGCGDSTGVEPDDLAGTWTATMMVFTSEADATESVDIVADEMATLEIVLDADETYASAFTFPDEADENETGTYSTTSTTLTITPTDGTAETFGLARDDDTMTLTRDDTYDFGSGEEPATLVITLAR
jgi:hypothetical protein